MPDYQLRPDVISGWAALGRFGVSRACIVPDGAPMARLQLRHQRLREVEQLADGAGFAVAGRFHERDSHPHVTIAWLAQTTAT